MRLALASLAGVLGVASGCAAILDFELGEDRGAGGSGPSGSSSATESVGGAPTGPGDPSGTGGSSGTEGGATSGSTGPGDPCEGCRDEAGTCVTGDEVLACGADGATCTACKASNECRVARCEGGACSETPRADGEPCVGGACRDGGCELVAEDCTNGVDDDGVNGADCLDPLCAPLATCLPDAPDGWTGPHAVYRGDQPVACPSVWPDEIASLGRQLTTGGTTCPTCTCDTACTMEVEVSGRADCSEPSPSQSVFVPSAPDVCVAAPPSGNTPRTVVPFAAQPMSCSSITSGAPTFGPVAYEVSITICEGPSGVCAEGGCFSNVPDDPQAEELTCIAAKGSLACPGSSYTTRIEAYEDFDDARACTDCGCGVGDCGGEVFVYDDPTCSACAGLCNGLDEGDCEAFPLGANLHLAYVADGTCQPVPSIPSGAVTPTDPWTVCCLP